MNVQDSSQLTTWDANQFHVLHTINVFSNKASKHLTNGIRVWLVKNIGWARITFVVWLSHCSNFCGLHNYATKDVWGFIFTDLMEL
jgi:hypothetical protein